MVKSFTVHTNNEIDEIRSVLVAEMSFLIVCVGFSENNTTQFTEAYRREYSENWLSLQRAAQPVESTVIVYVSRSEVDAFLSHLGYVPSTMLLTEDTYYSKMMKQYIRKYRIPMIRLTSSPKAVGDLSREDYYNGVCATMLESDIGDSTIVCPTLDYALLVSVRLNPSIVRTSEIDAGEFPTVPTAEAVTVSPAVVTLPESPADSGTDLPNVVVPPASAALFKHRKLVLPELAKVGAMLLGASIIVVGCI